MWYDDADIQIIGLYIEDEDKLSLEERTQLSFIKEDITRFNQSMRYKNVIKRQNDEIKKLKIDLLEEQLKNAKLELVSGESK